ncbi:TIGR03086 family metal-binding protein [Actinacidiphila paucisporea]|uniref:TIGR03086 family protein n=1 Tax=Actinacidiphila paucisporea TaxID=310782 RepID=A0A1M7IVP6_9ACTN|nr:TIGR03086 family metal-binding protein [Actinacidiphila paucisporea]SHM44820.1 TIGR03086 family protein [Actinacidiphila paucisporea]
MNFHAEIADSAREAARITAGVGPDRLTGPTPCPDYDVRALVNHLVAYTGIGMELRARREPHPDDLATRDFTADPQWAAHYAEQLDRSVAAWADPAVWEGEINSVPAEGMAAMLFLELCLHGWDLAKATGQDYRVADATARRLLAAVRENAQMYRDYKGFGEPVEVPAGAGDLETAVALSGRDPYWAG